MGDMETALKQQCRSQAAIKLLFKYGNIPAGKSFMKLCGIDIGHFEHVQLSH